MKFKIGLEMMLDANLHCDSVGRRELTVAALR
jgi:hypothetical protein